MKNSKLNTVLLVILIVLAIGIIWILWHIRKAEEGKDSAQSINSSVQKSQINDLNQGDLSNWEFTSGQEFQVLYNKAWYVEKVKEGYVFTLPSGNFLNWQYTGQVCTKDEDFQYGVSSSACVDGFTAWLGVENVREKNTQEDFNALGDFVLKNK